VVGGRLNVAGGVVVAGSVGGSGRFGREMGRFSGGKGRARGEGGVGEEG